MNASGVVLGTSGMVLSAGSRSVPTWDILHSPWRRSDTVHLSFILVLSGYVGSEYPCYACCTKIYMFKILKKVFKFLLKRVYFGASRAPMRILAQRLRVLHIILLAFSDIFHRSPSLAHRRSLFDQESIAEIATTSAA